MTECDCAEFRLLETWVMNTALQKEIEIFEIPELAFDCYAAGIIYVKIYTYKYV